MLTLSPYLVFNGNCEEAFNFYEQVFGGKILYMGRYKDVPLPSRQFFKAATNQQIMHASLQINAQTIIMGNDNVETYQKANGTVINNFFIYIATQSQAQAYGIFNQLATHGQIIMPMAQTFWTNHYGIVTDKFGINWKITSETE
ncbi:PhnB protein [Mucilaginibacter gracilis]|uniref:PhnB protein n=1 Tax=Mucilaginibacter gracilis TaxID=423350 RepID=A0A495J8Z9_9SPHI|nr:VOC family protein [Mucilaginibacter gracilis]RKR84874.1 PhnB protein [Mucilaginibacter gracilis]